MIKQYCRYCGKLKQLIPTGLYNEDNGKIQYKPVCTTIGCESYCLDRGGHKYESFFCFFWFGSSICRICGKKYK